MQDYLYESTGGIVIVGPDYYRLDAIVGEITGGMVILGSGDVRYGSDYYIEMSGFVFTGGLASVQQGFAAFVEMSGGLSLGGKSSLRISYPYTGSGLFYVGGIGAAPADDVYYFDLESTWKVQGNYALRFDSEWNVGETSFYWYRVETECTNLECPPIGFDENCPTIMIVNVLARNLSSLCRQLRNRNLVGRIRRISRFSRPARRSQRELNMQSGIDQSCDVLQDVPFCNIPECLDFCVDYTPQDEIGSEISAEVI